MPLPTTPTRPTGSGNNTGWAMFLKVNAAYDTTTEDDTNPDWVPEFSITGWSDNSANQSTTLAGGQRKTIYGEPSPEISFDLFGGSVGTKNLEIVGGAYAAGDARQANAAIRSPDLDYWDGWFLLKHNGPNTDHEGFKTNNFTLSPDGSIRFTAHT